MPGISGKCQIAGPLGNIKRAVYKLPRRQCMLRPRQERTEGNVCPRLVAQESAFLHEIVPELADAEPVLVIVEPRSREHRKPYIRETGSVAVAVLQAEIHHP